jgi:hypothetical protein
MTVDEALEVFRIGARVSRNPLEFGPAGEVLAAEVERLRQELRKAQQNISDGDVCCHGVGFDQDCEDCEFAETEAGHV